MKKSGSGRGSYGRSRSRRPARRRVSLGFNAGACSLLIVATGLGYLIGGHKAGAFAFGICAMVWVGAVLFRAQRRSLQS